MEYRIGLIGCGTVGQGFLEILEKKRYYLAENLGFRAKVVAISDMLKGSLLEPHGIDLAKLLSILNRRRKIDEYLEGKPNPAEGMDPIEMIETSDADIIAELTYTNIQTGEPATSYIRKAFQSRKHVVTSNKGPAALYYEELKTLAHKNNVLFRIEGTVMSGTPVFHLFENGLEANEIMEIKGILNGTTNFILTKMEEEDMDYEEALKLAQQKGYAEADPSADVEGYDALAKIIILSNVLLGANLKPADVRREGISSISKKDVQEALASGMRYKLIASAIKEKDKVRAAVLPQKLPLSDSLAGVMGANNALSFDLDLMGKVTIQGAGAGKIETGYSILSDMLAIHRRLSK
ncbi:MAG: homoserine dehydrogenase [Candidatus Aminicenantales bacterium]